MRCCSRRKIDFVRSFLPWLAVLAALLVFLEPTPLEIHIGGLSVDQWLQDKFFDFTTHRWLVDEHNKTGRLLFYDGPKILIIAFAVFTGIAALLPGKFRSRLAGLPAVFSDRRTGFFTLACLGLIPLVVGQLKAHTNVYCPYEETRYGGHAPYVRVWDSYSPEFKAYQKTHGERGRGFPAGHASGGFALMALAYVSRRRRMKIAGALFGVAAGWWMGGYQMLKGAHYLNHTLVTWCLAWLGVLLFARLFKPVGDVGATPSSLT